MITPEAVRAVCLRWWKEILLSHVDSTLYFPKDIERIGKVNSKEILNKLGEYRQAIEALKANSKPTKQRGYSLTLEQRYFDKIGPQLVPVKISVDTIEDYLEITKKGKEYRTFEENFLLIEKELPLLREWVKFNLFKVVEHASWKDTLKVCQYFLDNPKPELYIRQLPIEIHTKYISENQLLIQSLLDFLIPNRINSNETKFEKRYHLKYSQHLIRIRFLDQNISPLSGIDDISLPMSQFNNFDIECANVFVTENLMNFLTLPALKNTIALWSGGGFNVSYLKNAMWLKSKQFFYWGDIDAHGFQILNQFRAYFPNTIAVMMDEETLSNFEFAGGPHAQHQNLERLTATELNLYNHILQYRIRLEQEKIPQAFAEQRITHEIHIQCL